MMLAVVVARTQNSKSKRADGANDWGGVWRELGGDEQGAAAAQQGAAAVGERHGGFRRGGAAAEVADRVKERK